MSKRSSKSKPSKSGSGGKLAGKSVALVGEFGYTDMHRERYAGYVTAAGGKIVDPETTKPDLVLAGDGRGGKPPPLVAKIQKRHPAVQVVDIRAFGQMIAPSQEELCKELRSKKLTSERWDELRAMIGYRNVLDLCGADLRKLNLSKAKLDFSSLDGADLRQITAHHTEFPALVGTESQPKFSLDRVRPHR